MARVSLEGDVIEGTGLVTVEGRGFDISLHSGDDVSFTLYAGDARVRLRLDADTVSRFMKQLHDWGYPL